MKNRNVRARFKKELSRFAPENREVIIRILEHYSSPRRERLLERLLHAMSEGPPDALRAVIGEFDPGQTEADEELRDRNTHLLLRAWAERLKKQQKPPQ